MFAVTYEWINYCCTLPNGRDANHRITGLESDHHTNLSYYQELFLTDVRIKGIQFFTLCRKQILA